MKKGLDNRFQILSFYCLFNSPYNATPLYKAKGPNYARMSHWKVKSLKAVPGTCFKLVIAPITQSQNSSPMAN